MTQVSTAKPIILVVAAALVRADGHLLLAQRPDGKTMAGLWELPGGKIEAGESPEFALARELQEELAIAVAPEALEPFAFASHEYEGFHLLMPVFLCRSWGGYPTPQEGQQLAWVAAADIWDYPAPPADIPLFERFVDWTKELA